MPTASSLYGIYQFPCAAELSRQLPIAAVLLLIFAGPATAATGALTYLKDGNGFLSRTGAPISRYALRARRHDE